MACFFVFKGWEWRRNIHTYETCPIRHVLCVWMHRIRAEHKKRAILGALFVFKGWEQQRSNHTHETCPYGQVSCVWLEGDGAKCNGGWRTSQRQRTHPHRCVLCVWEEGMGVGVGLGVLGGGNVSRHKKKRKNRQMYLVHPACCFSVPLRPPLVAPCVFCRVCHVFDMSRPPRFVLCCSCQWSCLAVVLGPFQPSWGIVWRVLALTQWVGNGSRGE